MENLDSTSALDAPLAGATLQRPSDAETSVTAATPVAGTETIDRSDTGRAYPIGAVLGSYRLLQQIGAGGMGRVFIAEHVRLGRRVALKVLRSEYSGNRDAVRRFFAEARAVNCINHENIIEVSDFIDDASGPSFYIMELLCGIDLRTLEGREGVLPLPRALNIALQVCRGVGAAHDAGVIHRDLKPDNIFLIDRGDRHDFVKLLDFGVAKLSNHELDQRPSFQTSAGVVVGTPDYMAPEQAYGQEVDQRCDIYSLGVILFEMVAGRRPFVGHTAREVMVQHMTIEPPRPSQLNPSYDLPPELEELILACLRKDARERPARIQDVELQLAAILDKVLSGAAPARTRGRTPRRSARSRGWAATVGLMLALLSGGLFAWSQGFRPDIPVAQAANLVRALRGTKASSPTDTSAEAVAETVPAAAAVDMPAAAPGAPPAAVAATVPEARKGHLTVEAMTVVPRPTHAARALEPPTNRPTAAAAPAVAPRAAATPRRKPTNLDRDSVINPFE